MSIGKVAVFLREAECKAVRAAFASESGLGDSDTWFASRGPVSANLLASALAADPKTYELEGRSVFLSLYSELAHEDGRLLAFEQADLDRSKEHWVNALACLRGVTARTYVLNVFRHVPESRSDGPLRDPTGLRRYIRRLNRMGDELTSGGEAVLVDVDRALGSIGGRELKADFRWPQSEGLDSAIAGAATAVAEAVNTFPPSRL